MRIVGASRLRALIRASIREPRSPARRYIGRPRRDSRSKLLESQNLLDDGSRPTSHSARATCAEIVSADSSPSRGYSMPSDARK